MTRLHETARSSAPIEEIWKLLVDPSRYPEWWAGVAGVDDAEDDRFTSPWPQRVERRSRGEVVISCVTSDIRCDWRLTAAGRGTRIDVQVDIPDARAHAAGAQRALIRESLDRLAALV